MGAKRITVSEDAYETLMTYRREDESVSEAILRLTDEDRNPMAGFGSMSEVSGVREAVTGTRDDLDEDLRS